MDFLKSTIESILIDPYLKKEDFIKTYNIIFNECSLPSNTEINGKHIYVLLKDIFESHFKREKHTSFENFSENIFQYKKTIILIKNLFQYLERYYIFINVEQNNYNVMYLDKLFYNAYYDFYFKKHEKGFVDFFFKEKNLMLFYTDLLRLNNKKSELNDFKNYFINRTLKSIDYATPIETLISDIYEKIKGAREIFNSTHMEDMVKTIYRNFQQKTHFLIDILINEMKKDDSRGILIKKCSYVLREIEENETFLTAFCEKFENILKEIQDLEMHFNYFKKIYKTFNKLFKEEKYHTDMMKIFHRQTNFPNNILSNFFITHFTENEDFEILSLYLKMIDSEKLNKLLFKEVQIKLLRNEINVYLLMQFTSYFEYSCIYIHKICKITEDIFHTRSYKTLRMPFWSLNENKNKILSNEMQTIIKSIKIPEDNYRCFQITHEYSAVELKVNNFYLRCSLADADILFYIMQNKIKETDLKNYALDNLFSHKIIYKDNNEFLCINKLHKNLNIMNYTLKNASVEDEKINDLENIKIRSRLMKIIKREKKIKLNDLINMIENKQHGKIAMTYLLNKKYIEQKEDFIFYSA